MPKRLLPELEIRKKLCVTGPADELVFYRDGDGDDNNASHYLVPRCFDKVPPLYRTYAPPVASLDPALMPVFSGTLYNTETQPQEEAVRKILETWRKPPYSGILKLPPGCGKTVIAIAAAIRQKQPTLICVHTSVLMEQWCERLRAYAVVKGEEAAIPGRIRGKVFDIGSGKYFVVAMLQTLYRQRHEIRPETFGVVIVDEVHHVVARTYFQAVMNLPIRCVLGLSATPKRNDIPALNRILRYVMGDIIFEMVGESGAAATPSINPNQVHILMHHSESAICRKTFSNPEQARFKYLQEMTLDRIRNLGLITRLVACLQKEPTRQVLVLSHYVDHLVALEALFKLVWGEQQPQHQQHSTAAPTTGVIHGKVKLLARAEIFRDRQVLFSTYSLFKEGGDIPRLDTLVLTVPAGNIIQTAGRIMRGGVNNTTNAKPNAKLIMAIYNDNTYPGFATFDHLRHSHVQYFRKHGFEIQQSKLVEEVTLTHLI